MEAVVAIRGKTGEGEDVGEIGVDMVGAETGVDMVGGEIGVGVHMVVAVGDDRFFASRCFEAVWS